MIRNSIFGVLMLCLTSIITTHGVYIHAGKHKHIKYDVLFNEKRKEEIEGGGEWEGRGGEGRDGEVTIKNYENKWSLVTGTLTEC